MTWHLAMPKRFPVCRALGDYRLRQFSDAMLKPSFAYALPVSPACKAAHTDHMWPCPELPQLVTYPEMRYRVGVALRMTFKSHQRLFCAACTVA
jgi:hypothetical protein